jgi:enamine deaminase RidA (YjgF/YER057c/UK114 family)
MQHETINPWSWQDQYGYSQAVRTRNTSEMLYCAGQPSIGPDGIPVHAGDMAAQIYQALDNIEAVLTGAGFDWEHVVRLDMFTTDVDLLFQHYDVIATRLAEAGCVPASTLLGVTRLAYPELLVELEATAAR